MRKVKDKVRKVKDKMHKVKDKVHKVKDKMRKVKDKMHKVKDKMHKVKDKKQKVKDKKDKTNKTPPLPHWLIGTMIKFLEGVGTARTLTETFVSASNPLTKTFAIVGKARKGLTKPLPITKNPFTVWGALGGPESP